MCPRRRDARYATYAAAPNAHAAPTAAATRPRVTPSSRPDDVASDAEEVASANARASDDIATEGRTRARRSTTTCRPSRGVGARGPVHAPAVSGGTNATPRETDRRAARDAPEGVPRPAPPRRGSASVVFLRRQLSDSLASPDVSVDRRFDRPVSNPGSGERPSPTFVPMSILRSIRRRPAERKTNKTNVSR